MRDLCWCSRKCLPEEAIVMYMSVCGIDCYESDSQSEEEGECVVVLNTGYQNTYPPSKVRIFTSEDILTGPHIFKTVWVSLGSGD